MVFCADCGRPMEFERLPHGAEESKKVCYYICKARQADDKCIGHQITEKLLKGLMAIWAKMARIRATALRTRKKVEESTKSVVPGTVRAAAEQAENFLNGTRLTASMVSAFIENVFVYDGGRIVVRFKYEQSIQDAVKALHTG